MKALLMTLFWGGVALAAGEDPTPLKDPDHIVEMRIAFIKIQSCRRFDSSNHHLRRAEKYIRKAIFSERKKYKEEPEAYAREVESGESIGRYAGGLPRSS